MSGFLLASRMQKLLECFTNCFCHTITLCPWVFIIVSTEPDPHVRLEQSEIQGSSVWWNVTTQRELGNKGSCKRCPHRRSQTTKQWRTSDWLAGQMQLCNNNGSHSLRRADPLHYSAPLIRSTQRAGVKLQRQSATPALRLWDLGFSASWSALTDQALSSTRGFR